MPIKKCTCINEAQDTLHGDGMRVMNECKSVKESTKKKVRCTICLKENDMDK
jgi:hypothetical protein